MSNLFSNIVKGYLESDSQSIFAFKVGFTTGVAVFLVLAILTRLLFIFFAAQSRKCPGISIPASRGKIFVTASAIADLVERCADSFGHVRIDKVLLLKEKDSISINLHIVLQDREELLNTSEQLQSRILEILKSRFGIECVKTVNIKVKKILTAGLD